MTTMTHNVLSDGAEETRVAPSSAPLRLLVEGWRFMAHSYSIINHQQCLELLKRPDVDLAHRDVPLIPALGNPVYDMMGPDAERQIEAIPGSHAGRSADAVYRLGYPFDFSPSPFGATFVFASCDRGYFLPIDMLRPKDSDVRKLRPWHERVLAHGITIITASEWARQGIIRSGLDGGSVAVVPHGIDPDVFKPLDRDHRDAERKAKGQDGLFVFMHVSAMTGNKNPGGVIRAFIEVASRYPQARLVLKGMDRMYNSRTWVNQELARLSPAERILASKTIYYFGEAITQRDQAMFYQLADAYVSPYQSEGFNMPVMEAAACGLPVIVTDGGPTDEFTTPEFRLPVRAALGDHHHDGTLWFLTDHAALVSQMERAITDAAWRGRANAAGPEYMHARYSWERVVDVLVSTVRSRLSLKGTP